MLEGPDIKQRHKNHHDFDQLEADGMQTGDEDVVHVHTCISRCNRTIISGSAVRKLTDLTAKERPVLMCLAI